MRSTLFATCLFSLGLAAPAIGADLELGTPIAADAARSIAVATSIQSINQVVHQFNTSGRSVESGSLQIGAGALSNISMSVVNINTGNNVVQSGQVTSTIAVGSVESGGAGMGAGMGAGLGGLAGLGALR